MRQQSTPDLLNNHQLKTIQLMCYTLIGKTNKLRCNIWVMFICNFY